MSGCLYPHPYVDHGGEPQTFSQMRIPQLSRHTIPCRAEGAEEGRGKIPRPRTAGGGERLRKIVISIAATLVLFGAFLAFSGVATADHSFATADFGSRINVLGNCFGSVTYPADTLFWVSHGWAFFPWSDFSAQEKRAANHPSSTFTLLIDGEVQKSAQHTRVDPSVDVKFKSFVTEIHDGLPAGTYTFTDEHYIDGFFLGGDFKDSVLVLTCDVTVITI